MKIESDCSLYIGRKKEFQNTFLLLKRKSGTKNEILSANNNIAMFANDFIIQEKGQLLTQCCKI